MAGKPTTWQDRLTEAMLNAVAVVCICCGLAIGLALATGAWRWALTVDGVCL